MTIEKHVNIRDFRINDLIEGVYSLVNPQTAVTRAGKTYFKAIVRDASGEANVRKWTFDEAALGDVSATGYAHIVARVENYGGQLQLIIEEIQAVEVAAADLVALLPATTKNIDEMFAAVTEMLHSLENPAMRGLADAYLNDEPMMTAFRHAPAATSVHHAWIGGLLEHTHQLLQLADRMLPLYPKLNRDIVLMGLFLHDLGKTVELEWEKGFSYTLDGQLVGHLVRGAIWLQMKAAFAAKTSGHRLSPETVLVLQHILLSHHGALEHGSAKLPSTPEAIFVAMLDNLEAKTTVALIAAGRDRLHAGNADFTERVWSLDTRIYRPDPLSPPVPTHV